jgi:hypothetical protein
MYYPSPYRWQDIPSHNSPAIRVLSIAEVHDIVRYRQYEHYHETRCNPVLHAVQFSLGTVGRDPSSHLL